MQSRPHFAMLSIAAAILPFPVLKLLDYLNRGCGDGLCGVFSGLLILAGLAAATLIFGLKSARRRETPAILRIVPLALWALLLPILAF